MPFCHIDADVSLHYITNTPNGDATDLDHTKNTIILLPPIFGAVDMWLREQLKDPRLSNKYNLVAIDQRNMGSTKSLSNPKRDTWVDAADLAVAHEILRLPPCHVFAVSMNACGAALRFALLFPSKCISLGLCAMPVQAGEDPEWVEQGYRDIIQAYCFPEDMDTLEHACMEFSCFAFNNQATTEFQDEAVAWWQMNMPPTKRSRFLAQGIVGLRRSRLSDEELNAIKVPTIFIQGDKSLINPPNKAQELSDKMPNSRVFVVNGGPELMHVVPQYGSVVNRVYTQFLKACPTTVRSYPSDLARPNPSKVCKAGLARLAVFADDASVGRRDPSTPLSFCLLSADAITANAEQMAQFARGEHEALHALDDHGQPIRKFSERHVDEWKEDAYRRMQKQHAQENNLVAVFHTSSTYDSEEGVSDTHR